MADIDWLNVDPQHILVEQNTFFTCGNCGKRFLCIRDRCPFCGQVIRQFGYNGREYTISDGHVYVQHNGKLYVWDPQTAAMVPAAKLRRVRQSNHWSFGDYVGNMVGTTIIVLFLFILFVLIVAFLDINVFHGA